MPCTVTAAGILSNVRLRGSINPTSWSVTLSMLLPVPAAEPSHNPCCHHYTRQYPVSWPVSSSYLSCTSLSCFSCSSFWRCSSRSLCSFSSNSLFIFCSSSCCIRASISGRLTADIACVWKQFMVYETVVRNRANIL